MSRPRGAVVELNVLHGEMLPSYAHLAARAGIDAEFHVLSENLALGPFEGTGVEPTVVPIDVDDPHDPCRATDQLRERLLDGGYDFVLMCTPEPVDRLAFALDLPLPKLLVAHTPTGTLADHPDVTWVVLNRHATVRHPRAMLLDPWFAGPVPDREPRRDPVTFGVVGNLQLRRRNYGSLLRGLDRVRCAGFAPSDVQVRLIGRWTDAELPLGVPLGLDGPRFFAAAEERGLREFLAVTPAAQLSNGELRRELAGCHYALPLIDDFYAPTRPYLAGKASGGFAQAIASSTVPVANRRFAAGSGISGFHGHDLDDVATAMLAALEDDDDVLVASLVDDRERGLARSAARLRTWAEAL
ncbi:MAG TPA: hypothetical protein VK866_05335 [Acidimicrobiales bacterium]|nr:hypothetical protein [Acidimicrobiales bacterium]